MRALLIIFLIGTVCRLAAQDGFPSPYLIVQDSANIFIESRHWQLLEDDQQSFSIGQVSRLPLSKQFHADNSFEAGTHYRIKHWWIRVKLKNTMSREANFYLNGQNNISEDYFSKDGQHWTKQVTGWYAPWSQRDGLKRQLAIPLSIPPGDSLFIYRKCYYPIAVNVPTGFGPILMPQQAMTTALSDGSNFTGSLISELLAGICLFVFVLNILFFFLVKDRLYLYFALFILAEGMTVSYLFRFTLFKEHRIAEVWFIVIAGSTTILSELFFFRRLLNTRMLYPRWDRFQILFTCTVIAAGNFLVLVDFRQWYPLITGWAFWAQLLWAICLLPLLVTLFLHLRTKEKKLRLMVVAGLPCVAWWSAGGILFELDKRVNLFGGAFRNWYGEWVGVIEIAVIAWLACFFTWRLLLRFTDLRKEIVQKNLEKEILEKQQEQERNRLIAQQNAELEIKVEERTEELRHSLDNLKATQRQLVQSEKMASLGELTAGIAHEIQNPLNFVNNFAEVSTELIDEMQEALATSNPQLATDISEDIKENLQKINHHGKRADSIVKGMLQHSRSSSGQKEPTDINALCDEYLRLSYHGLRAKDKSFNAGMQTEFDPTLPKLNVVPQDIGRVVLNLINNAFYAVSEKKSKMSAGYEPMVTVGTKQENRKALIIVKDNGMGIPAAISDKIFQPFFTTKPTGQGTGLGLSMSYDIVTKGHGGELLVESEEGTYTQFTIIIPLIN